MDVVHGLAAHQRVDAARVVANHSTQRASAVRGRIGREREVMRFGGIAQAIQHDARLHAGCQPFRIERDDPVHVFRKIEDHRHVAALAGEACAAAARQHRRAELAGRPAIVACDIGLVQRDNQPDRHLSVVRRIGGVERARAVVETHFAADDTFQAPLELIGRRKSLARMRVRARSRMKLQTRYGHLSLSPDKTSHH